MRFLLFGSKGQLGLEFVKFFEKERKEYLSLSRQELDVTDVDSVYKVVKEYKPDIIINCTAYNQVDKAEEDFQSALKVNSIAVSNLAFISKEENIFLIHYSTDYVFDGLKEGLYTEEDKPNPINKYGLSKYLGEEFIKNSLDKYLLFRVSWVYGDGKQNFLYKLSQWAEKNPYLKVACDEFSVPTSTRTIVEVTLKAVEKGLVGLYHLTNSGYASRYEWAKEYFSIKGIKKFIYPAYRSDFEQNFPAKRPKWSAMSNEKISKELNIEIPDWKEKLKKSLYE
ncbi:MAG: dTDP-4-dehydrorhamnose reductase [Hydrogenothermaceae bacterium]|nr:dTDP-4-dehydrorhamnose reductase [Hydrogenothermaceae bacterium]